MSYHGLGQFVFTAKLAPAPQAPADWRVAVKAAAGAAANAVTAIPAKERLESARAPLWSALQTKLVTVAATGVPPNTETDPARRAIVESLAKKAVITRLGAFPTGTPTLQSTQLGAREAAPAVDVARAKHAAALALLAPPPPPVQFSIASTPKQMTITPLMLAPKPPPTVEEPKPAASEVPSPADLAPVVPEPGTEQHEEVQEPMLPIVSPVAAPAQPGLFGVPWLYVGLGAGAVAIGGLMLSRRAPTANRKKGKRSARLRRRK
jgi:hypothetical protein